FVLTAGKGEVEVYEKDSGLKLATKKFTLTRGGKETVSVELAPRAARVGGPDKPAVGNDRAAARWALGLGGWVDVRLAGRYARIHALKDLPAGAFQVTEIGLDKKPASDAGLAHLAGLTRLTTLGLNGAQVTAAGLAHLKGLTSLTSLNLDATRVNDAGLTH